MPPRAACFQNRSTITDAAAAAGIGNTAALAGKARSLVLSGLGGVGKTQLAAAFARTLWEQGEVDVLVWVEAMTQEAIVSGYATAAAELTGINDPDAHHAAQRCLNWLATTDKRWLVVLDDLQTPADLRRLWPPHTESGRVVVTTRRRDSALHGDRRHIIDVNLFTPSEAEVFLSERLHDSAQAQGAAELARALGYLPLALSQAAAYIADRPALTAAAYLQRFTDQHTDLARLLPDPAALPDDYSLTVAATWTLSVKLADQLTPAGVARPLLALCAVLDPNGIPDTALTTSAALIHLSTLTKRSVDSDIATEALSCLHRLSLITYTPSTPYQAVRVHALVQRATRDTFTSDELTTITHTAANALMEIWPDVERDTSLATVLRSNTTVLAAAANTLLWHPDAHPVLFRAGESLGETGQIAAAIEYHRGLYTIAQIELGPDHLDTLTIRHSIARWRGQAGDSAGAVTALQDVLTAELRVLGPDHANTLATRNELVRMLGEAGDPAGAAAAFQDLLVDYLRVLGPDHPGTLTVRNNLAYWRGKAGDPAGAVAAFQDLLADALRGLGPDHPDTITTRGNLANWRGLAGDSAGAAAAFQDLLTDYLRILGPDHPDTLATHHNLAYWRGQANDSAGAEAALKDILAHGLRVLGPDHPGTLIVRSNLANLKGEVGDPDGAVTAYQDLLTEYLRVLGPDHPDTLIARNNLAYWQGHAGNPAGAITDLRDLLTDYLRLLGPDHPDTLAVRNNLARWQGRLES